MDTNPKKDAWDAFFGPKNGTPFLPGTISYFPERSPEELALVREFIKHAERRAQILRIVASDQISPHAD